MTAGAPAGRSVFFFPDYSRANPVQTLLHAGLAAVGADAVPVTHLVKHLREQAGLPDPGVLNLHWTSPVLQKAPGPFRARLLLDRFAAALVAYRAAGGRLVWTIHNVLPHDARHRWAEVELAQLLADQADVVHLLSPVTLEAIGDQYVVDPAKTVLVGHSSYLGFYPDTVTPAQARERLGLDPGDTVLVTLGGIRPYKGLDLLLDAVDELAVAEPSLRLLLAGQPVVDPYVDELRERTAADPRVVASFEHVADDELQLWMRAADLAVLPYRAILNSGAFLLAQTFGLPVVGPRAGALLAEEAHPHVWLFEPGDRESLVGQVRAALAAVREDPDALTGSALTLARERSPQRMAQEYARMVQPLLRS